MLRTVGYFIDEYLKGYRNYKERWNYEDGCVLKGAWDLYSTTGEDRFKSFVLRYMDEYIDENGLIKGYNAGNHHLDDISSGRVLFDLYEITRDERYKKAIENIYGQILTQPRTREGNFWHKDIYPHQVWLDGLYMVMPFYTRYIKKFGSIDRFDDIYAQFLNVRKLMWNGDKKLYYHGYDSSRKEAWANKETGLSPNFWGRAEGWFVMALIDVLQEMDEEMQKAWGELKKIFKEAIEGLISYQDQRTGMWHQVLDKGGEEGNYLETSATLMFSYSILKGCRLGYLPVSFADFGLKAFYGTLQQYLSEKDGKLMLGGICSVAGLGNTPYRDGSYEYYISEKVSYNDPKGVGALMMAYSEILRQKSSTS